MSRSNPFEEVERLLESVSDGIELPTGDHVAVDLLDRAGEYVVHANLPGYEREALDVRIDGRTVTITAEGDGSSESGVADEPKDGGRYVVRERTRSDLRRRVRLPGDVDESKATASYEAGVLTATLPKREASGGHRIEVE